MAALKSKPCATCEAIKAFYRALKRAHPSLGKCEYCLGTGIVTYPASLDWSSKPRKKDLSGPEWTALDPVEWERLKIELDAAIGIL